MKRVFSFLLALCLILSLLPFGSFAAQNTKAESAKCGEVASFTPDKEYVLGVDNGDGTVSAITLNGSGVSSTVLTVTPAGEAPAYVEADSSELLWKYTSEGFLSNGSQYLYPSSSGLRLNSSGREITYDNGKLSFNTSSAGVYYLMFSDGSFGTGSDVSNAAAFRLFEKADDGSVQPTTPPVTGPSVNITPTTSNPEESAAIAVGETLAIKVNNGSSGNSYDFSVSLSDSSVAQIQGSSSVYIGAGDSGCFTVQGLSEGTVDITIQNNGQYSSRKATIHLTVVDNAGDCGHDSAELQNAKDATCTEEGYTGDMVCTVCGKINARGETIPALAHDWGDWKSYDGYAHIRYCSRCGANELDFSVASNGSCGDHMTWTLYDNGLLVISGYGQMTSSPWRDSHWTQEAVRSVEFSGDVATICDHAFYGCTSLTSITIPDSVSAIGNSAFSGCTGLTSIAIPGSVKTIEPSTFSGCSALTSVTIPDSVSAIGNYAFSDCTSLTSIAIPEGVEVVEYVTFSGCTALVSVSLPTSLKSIDPSAFYGCSSLTEITIPENVKSIYSSAFQNCSALTSVTLPETLHFIDSNVFRDCVSLADISLEHVNSIMGNAFSGCTSLSEALNLNLVQLGENAFSGCTGLREVDLAVNALPGFAFQGCTALEKFTLRDSAEISAYALGGCTALTEVHLPASLNTLNSNAFRGSDAITDVYYGCCSATMWSNVNVNATGNSSLLNAAWHYADHQIERQNHREPTCTEWGYYGDDVCTVCGETVAWGYELEPVPHQPELYNAKEPTCAEPGYTGDTVCLKCGETIELGSVIPALGHSWGEWEMGDTTRSRTCAVCGETEVELLIDPTAEIAVTPSTDNPSANATINVGDTLAIKVTNGSSYSAYDFSASLSNSEVAVIQGNVSLSIASGDTGTFIVKALSDGNVDITISNNNASGDQYTRKATIYLTVGDGGCDHPNTAVSGLKDATCTEAGYTGDIVCLKCGETIELGSVIPALGHSWGEWEMGDTTRSHTCAVCGETEVEQLIDPTTPPTTEIAVTPTTDNPSANATINVGDTLAIKVTNGSSSNSYDFSASLSNSSIAQIQGSNPVYIAAGGSGIFSVKGLAVGTVDITIQNESSYGSQYVRKATVHLTVVNNVGDCGHDSAELQNAKDATCTEAGYTGDMVCTVCGKINARGETIPALGHDWGDWESYDGYAHIRYCARCGASELDLSAVSNGSCGDHMTWTLYDNGLLVISGYGQMTSSPWRDSHWTQEAVRSVEFSGDVATICVDAFYGCTNLTSITIPDSVSVIERYAFYDCTSLTSIEIPDSVKTIEGYTFADCTALNSITIPDSVSAIGSSAFYNCTSLTSIAIPEGVEAVDYNTFSGCTALVSVSLPTSLKTILSGAFSGCTSLTSIAIPDSVSSIGDYAFYGCSSLTEIAIPENVNSINSSAFQNCSALTSITLPETVNYIGENAFRDCVSLADIYLEHVNFIMDNAFSDCTSLTEVHISRLYQLGENVFSGCTGLREADLSVNALPGFAFQGCTALEKFALRDAAEISAYALGGCTSLTEVYLPASLNTLNSNAFRGSDAITDVYYGGCSATMWSNVNVNATGNSSLLNAAWHYADHQIERQNHREPTCTEWGYYGDDVCTVCGETVAWGYELEPVSHQPELYNAKEPTCADPGYTGDWVCAVCGELVEQGSVIPAADHTWGEWYVTLAPTENEVGYEARTCSVCGERETREIPVLVHVHSLTAVAAKAPTCTETGHEAYWVCEGCGKRFSDAEGKNEISAPVVIPRLDHQTELRNVQESTCEGWGWTGDWVCTVCGQIVEQGHMMPPNGHQTELRNYIEPTCTESGYSGDWVCTVCGQTVEQGYLTPPNGHQTELQNYVPATPFESGYSGDEICTCCGALVRAGEVTPPTWSGTCGDGLTWRVDENGVLTITGAGDMTSSPWRNDSQLRSAIRTVVITDTLTQISEDVFVGCRNLDEVYYSGSKASWDNAVDAGGGSVPSKVHVHFETTSPEGHFYEVNVHATCTEDGYTARMCDCGYEYDRVVTEPAHGHEWTEWTTIKEPTPETNGISMRVCAIDRTHVEFKALRYSGFAITAQPEDQVAPIGGSAVFTVAADGEGLTYQWEYRLPGKTMWYASGFAGADTATLTVPVSSRRDRQSYRCRITDQNGDVILSDAAVLTVGQPQQTLQITAQPQDQTGTLNANVVFSVQATGENLTYQWQYSQPGKNTWYNSSAAGAKTDTLTIQATAKRDGQRYRCVIKDANGVTVTSEAATLYVTTAAVFAITSQPMDQTVPVGGTAVFAVEASGEGLNYQWQYCSPGKNTWYNSTAAGATTATLEIQALAKRDGQRYRCVVTDASGGTLTSGPATLHIG